ncbi:indole-3-glycerol phosphate synthase TrpC [Iamia sp. SCSIO 61187]|uniref:indole-3-glycerol phosphate synthase TrpC n=1 Tax=Iamia sp. SCSIO 61187 TaxID=2722752 RepID=UPI001C628319|nr:indole-3-glycerol phosphate synthase TrpC [Iamia sp. SCSIO 61187]QYG93346.1 indole-3-glycerol phosphate synthase TrpC [Iamia sp. SCSIO 61187]
MPETYLDRIIDAHRQAAAADRRRQGAIEETAEKAMADGPTRGFRVALAADHAAGNLAVIAEIKRRSPSKGDLAPDLVAGSVAEAYAEGGAAALSVLTDLDFFGGSPADLGEARGAVEVPVLRKDFTVVEADVLDARAMGADAVLLIVAALDDHQLADYRALAAEVGLDVLVEAHDEAEVERALEAGADLVGVNQRDLFTFEVDTDRAVRVAGEIPEGVVRVAESGVRGPDDARRLADAGYHAVLVGESVVTDGDPAAAVRALRAARRDPAADE